MSSQQAKNTTSTALTVTITSDSLPVILEMCAGLFSMLDGWIILMFAFKAQRTALEQLTNEVYGSINSINIQQLKKDPHAEYEMAKARFGDRVSNVEKKEKINYVAKKLGSMKAAPENPGIKFDNKELDDMKTKLEEVEQITSKKRKANEINGGAGAN